MTIAYGIFSGGLDSMLASRLLLDQGVDVRLLTFVTPFFGAKKAMESGRYLGLVPRAVDITSPYLTMWANPKYGFGRFANPCIDCHAFMFREAGRIMRAEGGDFLFSGEVLGQRPKSQTLQAMGLVTKASGFGDFILRPLSARVLPPTKMETDGLVNREKLGNLSGRTRKPQMALAASYGLNDYPSPAGGCLLTDPAYSRRLKELAAHVPRYEARDAELLKWGRHLRLSSGYKLIVGRNQVENEAMEALVLPGDLRLLVDDIPGPLGLIPGGAALPPRAPEVTTAAAITASYSDAAVGQAVRVFISPPESLPALDLVTGLKAEFSKLMIC
ncbi:MAG: tRNA 4-thiouridine(8) synthase ThiI [Deltaproteobacteria bacterium]|nr:tRNA 4-thiouridine(8) synthase ThiI [Deltaproteobacteria bacterium]